MPRLKRSKPVNITFSGNAARRHISREMKDETTTTYEAETLRGSMERAFSLIEESKRTFTAAIRFLCVGWTLSWMTLFAVSWNLSLLSSSKAYVQYLEPVTSIASVEGVALILAVAGLFILLYNALLQLWQSARVNA